MKTGWWSFELPKYRPHPTPSTYSLFSYEDLPPIQEKLDGDFSWLRSQSLKKSSLAEGAYSDGSKPNLNKLSKIVTEAGVKLPRSFTYFIETVELHQRIRSCTDCYLDVGDHTVRTQGACKGFLVHFLSDSQWCLHWYVFVDDVGNHFVVVSQNTYGFTPKEAEPNCNAPDPTEAIALEHQDIWFCAPTFTEFIYRFWLENEIWFALKGDKRPLTTIEQAHVDHYFDRE